MTPLPEVDNFAQITTFALAIGVGLALCLLYDLFRILRLLWPPSQLLLFFEDVLYWVLSALVVFCFLLVRCDGSIRFFAVLGLILGWLGCHLTISRWIYRVSARLVKALRAMARWIRRHIFRPIARLLGWIYRLISRTLKKLCRLVKKVPVFLKKCLHWRKRVVYNQHNTQEDPDDAAQNASQRDDTPHALHKKGSGFHESRRKKKEKRKSDR